MHADGAAGTRIDLGGSGCLSRLVRFEEGHTRSLRADVGAIGRRYVVAIDVPVKKEDGSIDTKNLAKITNGVFDLPLEIKSRLDIR